MSQEIKPAGLIDQWRVVGDKRVCGIAKNRFGKADGGTIITSPVIRIIHTPGGVPLAVTQSGSHYQLGDIAPGIGAHQAAEFMFQMTQRVDEQPTQPMELPSLAEQDRTYTRTRIFRERHESEGTAFQPFSF